MSSIDIRFYLSIFLRRLPYFAIIAVCTTILGIAVAYLLPPVYQADAKILVESPQISTDLARSTIPEQIEKQLQRLELQMMTRANILALASRTGLYREKDDVSPEDIVDSIRSSTKIEPVQLNASGRGEATGFSISFKASDPVLAANVVNEFVDILLQRNASLRTVQAGDTLQFFQQEVEKHRKRLQEIEAQIIEFKNAHKEALPESLAFRQGQQISFQEKLFQIEREEAALRDERSRTAQMVLLGTGGSAAGMTLKEQTLEQFRRVLIDKRAIFSETSPAIVALQAQIASLENEIQLEKAKGAEESNGKRRPTEMELRLAEISRKIAFIPQEKENLKKRLAELNESIAATPATETALRALDREYQNVQAQYNAATTRLSDATIGQQIESRSIGERLSVLEEALPPRYPVQPKRRLIAAGGLAFGIALGAGFILLLELLSNKVRRPVDLINKLDIEPLVAIPYIDNNSQSQIKRVGPTPATIAVLVGILTALGSLPHGKRAFDLSGERHFTNDVIYRVS